MNKELEALDQLIDEAVNKEKSLEIRADELALQSKQFADYLAEKKHNDEALEALWSMVKEYMLTNNISEHENDFIKLKLTPSGKYKAADIDSVDDALCDIKKTINNKKVKSYVELNGKLPEGVESTGYVLRKTLKEG
jgi:hypothetical protein